MAASPSQRGTRGQRGTRNLRGTWSRATSSGLSRWTRHCSVPPPVLEPYTPLTGTVLVSQLFRQHCPPPPPTLSRQGAPTSQIREKDEDSGGGRGCVLCQGAHGLSDSDNHRGASLERPQKLQHCLNSCPGAPGRQRAGCGGGQGGCPAHRQTCAFSVAWDNPGPLADRWASAQSLC